VSKPGKQTLDIGVHRFFGGGIGLLTNNKRL
jgi:hypothetical protein